MYDTETGTVYLRARYYNPSTGRFTSRDSFAGKNEDPLSLNLYTYCHNSPTINVDPSGHFILSAILIGAAIGTAVSGGVSLYKEAKSAGGISNMTSDNWKNVGMSIVVGGVCGGFGTLGALAAGSLITSSATSPLIVSATTSSLGYAVGTGIAGGMAGSCASTITQQALYGYSDPYEIARNTVIGGVTGGATSGTLWAASRASISTITDKVLSSGKRTWGNRLTLTDHYERHGGDFNARNEDHYARMAHRFYVNRYNYQTKVDSNGVIRVYDKNTNSFGSYNSDGTTKTYFKLKSPNYFNNQPGE